MESLPLEAILSHLTDTDRPLHNTELTELSDLSREELATFRERFSLLPPKRRLHITNRLAELGENNFELSFDGIFRLLLCDEDAGVRQSAIKGLWDCDDASLIRSLINLMERDSSDEVRAAAAAALGRFAVLAEHGKLRPVYVESLRRSLLQAARDEKNPVELRRRALEAVSPLSLAEVSEAITLAYNSGDPKFKASAVYAMGRSCDTTWLPLLYKEIKSTDAELRYEAATALGEIGEEESVAYLIELLEDPDPEVQLAAIRSLGQVGGAEARSCLRQCLQSDSEAVSQAAEEALEDLASGEDPLGFRI
ncbi:MAG: HEAT repeat domain-containing protein [Chloroflexota bacterium]